MVMRLSSLAPSDPMQSQSDAPVPTERMHVHEYCAHYALMAWQNQDLAAAILQYEYGSVDEHVQRRYASIIREHRMRWERAGADD